MKRRLPLVVALGLAALVLVLVARHRGSPALSPLRASWTLTPGVLNPDVDQSTIGSTICTRGWTATIRPPASYTSDLKVKQMAVYDFTGSPADYQEDHLISLELGGNATDPRNLWPERRPRANDVDLIENELNAEVCSGKLTLAEAQRRESEIKHTKG